MLILFWNCFKVKSRPAPIKYKSLRGHVWLENSSFPVKRICNYKFIACISKCFLRICCYLSKTLEMAFLQNCHLSASCLHYRRVSNSIGVVELNKISTHLYQIVSILRISRNSNYVMVSIMNNDSLDVI